MSWILGLIINVKSGSNKINSILIISSNSNKIRIGYIQQWETKCSVVVCWYRQVGGVVLVEYWWMYCGTAFFLLSPHFYPFKPPLLPNADCFPICPRNAIDVYPFFSCFQLFTSFWVQVVVLYWRSIPHQKLTFHKQQTHKNKNKKHLLCSLQTTLKTIKCNKFNY